MKIRHLFVLVFLLALPLLSLVGCDRADNTSDIPIKENSPVVINELCADNKGSLVTDGELYDWIELYNRTDEAIDLSGWSLSDDRNYLRSNPFPRGTLIDAHSYLVVLAIGETAYADRGSTKPAVPFKLSEDGETVYLTANDGEVADMVTYPGIHQKEIEVTYARVTDGDPVWGEADPTLAAPNDDNIRELSPDVISFSHESGFYENAFDVTLSVPEGYRLFYTTDCSDPMNSPTATRWDGTEPIRVYDRSPEADTYSSVNVTGGYMYDPADPVDKCFTLRAYARMKDGTSTRVITKTYFVGYGEKDGYTNIPVVTLTANPEDLYDEKNGLFINDDWGHDPNANRWEIEADMTYMDADGTYRFGQKVGIRIRGTSTRGIHQKNLNVFARSRYDGNSSFVYPLFEGVDGTKSFVLRNDQTDDLKLGQGYLQDLVADRSISTQKNYPVAVFLEGEYYGIYHLYERFSEDYVESHYGVDSNNVWITKKGGAPSSMESNCDEAGKDYTALMHFICNVGQYNDLSNPTTYARLTEWVDVRSLADILAVQLYLGNEDFSMSQNITAWRSITKDPANPYADGRWRFVIYDLDYTLNCSAKVNGTEVIYDHFYDPFTMPQPWAGGGFMTWSYNWNASQPFTRNLLKSATFKSLLISTFESLAENEFSYARVKPLMEAKYDDLLPNMKNYVNRYHNRTKWSDAELQAAFRTNVEADMEYFRLRAQFLLPYLYSAFGT